LVERVILQCLEKDPRKRPASALQVSAALPGGDPLQAALAAGETPSPEMVAASGEKAGVRPVVALACLGAIAAGLIVAMVLGGKASLLNVTLDNPPVALMRQARVVSAQLGYPERVLDTDYGMRVDDGYLRHLDQTAGSSEAARRLASVDPRAILFWYRESPDFLRSLRTTGGGRVTEMDPPPDTAGMIGLELDAAGHLRTFDAVPPLVEQDGAGTTAIDWKVPFALAGLDISTFTATAPQLIPRHAHDQHGAWIQTISGQPDAAVRVEAAARRGKLVQFTVSEPWTKPTMQQGPDEGRATGIFVFVLISTVLLGAARLAWGNLRRGRGDRQGAYRLFCFIAIISLLSWLFRADHVPTIDQRTLIAQAIKDALFLGGITWLLYLALEPFVRRRWPQTIVSWSRLLDGEFRDPLVGRDLLFGILAGTVFAVLYVAANLWSRELHGTHTATVQDLSPLLGVRDSAGWFVNSLFFLQFTLAIFFVIFVLRAIVRHEWIAVVLFVLVAAVPSLLGRQSAPELVTALVFFVGVYYLAVRLGLISLTVGLWVSHVLTVHPLTIDLSAWYAGFSVALVW
jgi:serine/threonine-protein kinase